MTILWLMLPVREPEPGDAARMLTKYRLTPETLKELNKTQAGLLEKAFNHIRRGEAGRVYYLFDFTG